MMMVRMMMDDDVVDVGMLGPWRDAGEDAGGADVGFFWVRWSFVMDLHGSSSGG